MLRSVASTIALAAVLAACSSAGGESDPAPSGPTGGSTTPIPSDPNTRTGEIKASETWKDGMTLNGVVLIGANATVTIPAGVTIKVLDGTQIIVSGTLKVSLGATNAKITGASWNGINVDKGGTLDAQGLDIENAKGAVALLEGAKDSVFSGGRITSSVRPFGVSTGTKLTVTNAIATVPDVVDPTLPSVSDVFGTLVANKLDYDAKSNEGISVKTGGTLDMIDSSVHGKSGHDMVSAYGAKLVKISYSHFSGAHCGVHIQPAESFVIDHITSDDNLYGMTIYQSGGGPNTVTASNLTGLAAWLDFAGDNGPITFDGVYTTGAEAMNGGPPPTVTKAQTPVADAKPR